MKIDTSVKRILMLLLAICFAGTTQAQENGKVVKANKKYDKYAYIDAREIFLKVVEEDSITSPDIYQKLGNTFYFNAEYADAANWYIKSIEEYPSQTDPVYYYRAAQSFKSLNNYKEADKWMDVFSALKGDTRIAKIYDEDPQYLKTIAFDAGGYELEMVGVNTEGSDFGPSYYLNKLVFASSTTNAEWKKIHEWNKQPFLDLFVADMDAEGRLSNPTPLKGTINTPLHESSTAFTKDGNTVYFTRNNFIDGKKGRDENKTVRLKLYKATKIADSAWGNIKELPFNNDTISVAHPALSLDEKKLYFSSDRTGGFGQSDIWYVDIKGGDSYGTPKNLGIWFNTEERESFPFISDKNNLYFSSDGRSGLGGLDIFVIPIDSIGKSGKIKNLGEPANSNQDDFGFIINEEKSIGYLTSNRDNPRKGSIGDQIYRVQVLICEITITGIVTNINEKSNSYGQPIEGATVELLDAQNKLLETVISGADGTYEFSQKAACSAQYSVRAKGDFCDSNEEVVQTPDKTGIINVPIGMRCCPPNDLGCILNLNPIYFDFDKWNIRSPDATNELAQVYAAMRDNPQMIIHIESHTDSRGNDAYNEALSEKRAQSTLNWLVAKGINPNRLSAKGYGEYQLQNQCSNGVKCTEVEHQLNRRSMFLIQNMD